MDTSRSHSRFNDERENVLKDIGNFLFMVFGFLKEMTEHGVFIKSDRKLRNLELVIESLCLIHGLYGYPAETSDNPGNVTELLTLETPTLSTYHDCKIARSVDKYREKSLFLYETHFRFAQNFTQIDYTITKTL